MRPSSSNPENFRWEQIAHYYQPLSTPVCDGGWPVQLAVSSVRRETGPDGAEVFVFEPAFAVLIDRRDGIGRIAAPQLLEETCPLPARYSIC